MDVFSAIQNRRSVRSFTEQPVSQDDIKAVLEAAMSAPSAGNAQPWHFVVIDDKEILAAIPPIHPYGSMAKDAPLGILVCADKTTEKHPGFWVQDCSAAIQNMLLAVVGRGLGAVWTGIYPVEKLVEDFAEKFKTPHYVVPLALILIGHPKSEQMPVDRFNEKRIHHNRW